MYWSVWADNAPLIRSRNQLSYSRANCPMMTKQRTALRWTSWFPTSCFIESTICLTRSFLSNTEHAAATHQQFTNTHKAPASPTWTSTAELAYLSESKGSRQWIVPSTQHRHHFDTSGTADQSQSGLSVLGWKKWLQHACDGGEQHERTLTVRNHHRDEGAQHQHEISIFNELQDFSNHRIVCDRISIAW